MISDGISCGRFISVPDSAILIDFESFPDFVSGTYYRSGTMEDVKAYSDFVGVVYFAGAQIFHQEVDGMERSAFRICTIDRATEAKEKDGQFVLIGGDSMHEILCGDRGKVEVYIVQTKLKSMLYGMCIVEIVVGFMENPISEKLDKFFH